MTRPALIALLCVFMAFTASAIVSRTTFERLPHLEDEFAYLFQARIFARGDVYVDTPTPRRAYWQPFLLDVNDRRFGKYTPGWPLLLAAGVDTGQPWAINAWAAMLSVALIYRLGRELFSPAAGAVAALLLATSPTMLLLNGTLMGHTPALTCTLLLLYALWRLEKRPQPKPVGKVGVLSPPHRRRGVGGGTDAARILSWAIIAGLALGLLILNRPYTAAALAAPLVITSGGRVAWAALRQSWRSGWQTARPLIVLAVVAAGIAALWPAFNYTVSAPRGESFPAYLGRFLRGDDDTNLYLRIWSYDRPGFGPGHGRAEGGHTVKLGWQHTRRDLRCAARDVFGWAAPSEEGVTVEENNCVATSPGYGWLMIPVGLVVGMRRRWTWLLLALPVCLTAAYVAYWAGGRVYSARYLSEGIGAVALISGVGIVGLARLVVRLGIRFPVVYAACGLMALYALLIYTPARLEPLHGYARIRQAQIDEVNRLRREPGRPLAVIAVGGHWRDAGALMAITSPYRDSDIVLARDPDGTTVDLLRELWQGREIIYFIEGQFTPLPPEG